MKALYIPAVAVKHVEIDQIGENQAPFAPLYFARRNALIKPYVKGLVTSSMEGDIPGDFFLSKISIQGRSS